MLKRVFALFAMIVTLVFSTSAFAAYERTANNTVPAYTDPELNNRNGNERVDAGDRLIVFEERGTALFVRYPVRNGTKDRWVSKGVFTETISDGWYRLKPTHDLGHSADALGLQVGSGNNIHLWESIDCDQQKFYLQNRGNGYFSLQSAYGSRHFVTSDGANNGSNLYTAPWNGSDYQLFRLVNGGNNSYHIFSKAGNNLNFDCAGAGSGNGTNLQLWTIGDVGWHKWVLERVNGPSQPATSNTQTITAPMKNMYCTWRSHSNWGWSDYTYISSHPDRSWHLGIDVYGDNGYVYSMADGTVELCSNSNNGGGANGRYIVIKHNIGGQIFYSFYAHLASINVSNGQHVSAGDRIAVAGGSGSGNDHLYKTHLHFAIVDTLKPGSYYGYATKFSGNSVRFGDVTFYNPRYVLQNGRLP